MNHAIRKTMLLMLACGLALFGPTAEAQAGKTPEKPASRKREKSNKNKMFKRSVYGYAERGYIGLELLPLNTELRSHFGGDAESGMLVARVEDGGPADRAGLKVGDLLLSMAGAKVRSVRQVVRQIHNRKKGDKIALRRARDGRVKTIHVTLDRRKVPQIEVSRFIWTWPPRNGKAPAGTWDDETFEGAMQRFHQAFPRPGRTPATPNYFDYSRQKRLLEKRLKEMEKKLQQLEKRLQSKATLR